jgi:alpha-glucoside transport system permease protein
MRRKANGSASPAGLALTDDLVTGGEIDVVQSATTTDNAVLSAPAHGTGRRLRLRLVGWLGSFFVQVVLAVVALFWIVPVFGLVVASLRPQSESLSGGWWTALTQPAQLTLANYGRLLDNELLRDSLVNTVLIAVPSTVLVVGIAALAGYALAWIDFPASDWLVLGIAALLVIPFHVALIPVAKLYTWLGLNGTILGVVLYHVAFGLPFAIFLLRNFYIGIPRDLIEAARMDGAREWCIFRRVVVPVCRPALAALAVFEFLWVWNDFLVALVFADPSSMPITVALRQELVQFGTSVDVLSAGSLLSMLVPLAVFFVLQRHFVQGILAGSAK